MRTIRLRARAESDLVDIWLYSSQEWDELQADKYLDELNDAINSLARNPERGIRRDSAREGYRALSRHRCLLQCAPRRIKRNRRNRRTLASSKPNRRQT